GRSGAGRGGSARRISRRGGNGGSASRSIGGNRRPQLFAGPPDSDHALSGRPRCKVSRGQIRKTRAQDGSLRTIRASPPTRRPDAITILGSAHRGDGFIDDFDATVRTRVKT